MKKWRVGIIGVGGIFNGAHREHYLKDDRLEVVALCDIIEERAVECRDGFFPDAKVYTDFNELLKDETIDSVDICTPNYLHSIIAVAAFKAGKHVFCEKPLGTDVAQCKAAEKVIEAHPDLIFQLGFMRRFDKSYVEAKRKIDNGDIGKVVLVRSYTQDPRSTIESTLKFAPHSGGQYLDMCVHDIDLIRWFTGSDVKNVWAIGGVFEFDLYKELNDADNAAATIQMENGAMGFMFTNRTHGAGCNVETEIIGTHGTLRIANVGAKNLLQIVDGSGAREEYYPDFLSRWHQAYINEIQEFVSCINEGRKPGVTVYDGTKATLVPYAITDSFHSGKPVQVQY